VKRHEKNTGKIMGKAIVKRVIRIWKKSPAE